MKYNLFFAILIIFAVVVARSEDKINPIITFNWPTATTKKQRHVVPWIIKQYVAPAKRRDK